MRKQTAVELVKEAVDQLLACNDGMESKQAGEVYMGRGIVAVKLVEPVVIEGVCYEASDTVDVMELIRMAEERAWA